MPQTVPASGPSRGGGAGAPHSPDAPRAVPRSPPCLRRLLRAFGEPPTPPPLDLPATIHDLPPAPLKGGSLDRESRLPELSVSTDPGAAATEGYMQSDAHHSFLDQYYFGSSSPNYPTPSPSSEEGSLCPAPPHPDTPYDSPTSVHSDLEFSLSNLQSIKTEPDTRYLSSVYAQNSPYSPSSPCSQSRSLGYTPYRSENSLKCNRPSPLRLSVDIVPEEYIDIEKLLKENQILQDSSRQDERKTFVDSDFCNLLLTPKQELEEKPRDYQLLREVLEDTTFQKRFNLKPFSFDSFDTAYSGLTESFMKMEETEDEELLSPRSHALANEKIDQVLSLAIEQTRKDVDSTCAALGISQDPLAWSQSDVAAWLQLTATQFALLPPPLELFSMDGAQLTHLSEQEFNSRAPQAGSTLFAQLEIWKAARAGWGPPLSTPAPSVSCTEEPISEDEEESGTHRSAGSEAGLGAGAGVAPRAARAGGAHIHLWQFLKELLAAPQLHGAAIRWLDRESGVFKIEDSVRVARLWGKRKNRPAMNYDKLSRSIRQYYKKGIMKKTERSQRLVYQFCHPYNL